MLDLAQHLVTSIDLSVLSPSAIDLAGNLHINPVDLNLAGLNPHIHMDLIAQQFKQDVMGEFGKGWNNFVQTGQIWALIIGVVVGYLFRSITAA